MYVHIYIFCVVETTKLFFAHGPTEYGLFLDRYIWPMDGTLKVLPLSDKSESRCHGNKGVHHIRHISKTGASPSDAASCYT